MYASILRFRLDTTRRGDPFELGWRLADELSGSPGFVAAVLLEDTCRALVAISLFEDHASLTAATPLTKRWVAQQSGTLEPEGIELATGEIVAQRGL